MRRFGPSVMNPPLLVDDAFELLAFPPDDDTFVFDDALDATDADEMPDDNVLDDSASFLDADDRPELIDSAAMLLTDAQSV